MENLKIVINGNEDIAKKAKEYFEILGYYISNENRNNYYGWSLGENSGGYYVSVFYFNKDKAKLVTVEQLREMVFLKRNSIEDAQFEDNFGDKWYVDSSLGFWMFEGKGWRKATKPLFELKSIYKNPMKEYLDKNRNYELVLCAEKDKEEGFIEVPEGAECAMLNSDYSLNFFKNINGDLHYYNDATDGNWFKSFFGIDSSVVWQRHTQPEELPFVDDEPKLNIPDEGRIVESLLTDDGLKIKVATGHHLDNLAKINGARTRNDGESDISYRQYLRNFIVSNRTKSLNNQYAEIEKVRQHNHYFKDVSNLNEIDVYMVLKLFNVTDPCLQHIAKKALCAGQRGHKNFKRDLRDILDTAKRAVEINNG